MKTQKIKALLGVVAATIVGALLFTNAANSMTEYSFLDFLPLGEQRLGQLHLDPDPNNIYSARWFIHPLGASNGLNKTEIEFRCNPDIPTSCPPVRKYSRDIWEYPRSGPLGLKWAYLVGHGSRTYDSTTNSYPDEENVVHPIQLVKSRILRYVDNTWEDTGYIGGVDGFTAGIPYARMDWKIGYGVPLKYIVQNWYYIGAQKNVRVFHEQLFEHSEEATVTNTFWANPNTQTRKFIKLSEAYWQLPDQNGNGWIIGKDDPQQTWISFDGETGEWPSGTRIMNGAVLFQQNYGRIRWHSYKTVTSSGGLEPGVMAFKIERIVDDTTLTFGTKFTAPYSNF